MISEKYSKLPIDPVVTELYRQGPNIDFDFPPTAARLLDILASKLTPQSPQATLDASDYARACGYTSSAALQKQVRKDLEALKKYVNAEKSEPEQSKRKLERRGRFNELGRNGEMVCDADKIVKEHMREI